MLNSMEPGSSSDSTSGVAGTQMENTSCFWEKLNLKSDPTSNEAYEYVYAVSATAAFACTSYLMMNKDKFQMRKVAYQDSYNFFTIFLCAMHLRVFAPKLCHFVAKYAKPEYINCEGCALLDCFCNVMEMELLTHICINRYVVAKYIYNGWPINRSHNVLYLRLCLFFAFLYSLPPVFGLGNYSMDFDCETCAFDMILPEDWTRYVIVGIWLLRSVKPVIFMLVMLTWTRRLEAKFTNQMMMKSDTLFTRIVAAVTFACLFCWAPLAVARGCVIFSQLYCGEIYFPTADFVNYAPIIYEFSPVLVTLAIVVANSNLPDIQMPFEELVDEKKQE